MKNTYKTLSIAILSLALLLAVSAFGVSAASLPQTPPPYEYHLPLVFGPYEPPPPAPPNYFTTSWYMTPANVLITYQRGCAAGNQTVQLPGVQDSLIILDYGQPWGEGTQYGTILLQEPGFTFTSTNDIEIYTKNFITGYMACSDGVSLLDVGIGTTNYARYVDGVCTSLSWYCTESRAYNHGRAWAAMVRSVQSWVISNNYARQVKVSGANDIELSWNYASISNKWVEGFDSNDNNQVIFYNFGTCDGCPTRLAPNTNPDLVYDWTFPLVHYAAWRAAPAWPIPEIYATSGINARQWAYLSKWGVDQGYSKMQFLSALTQYQACNADCPELDNTPQQAWHQLYNETAFWPVTKLTSLPWMTDIEWP